MRTRMAVLYRCGEPLAIEEVEIPPLKTGEVLVKVLYSGICGSQLSERDGKWGLDKYTPHTLGHEGSGVVVVDLHKGVKKVRTGDHVIISWIKGSGTEGDPPKYSNNGNMINAGFANTFTEYSIVSENRLVPITKEMPLDKASILGCAIATGFGAVTNEARVRPETTVLVIGTGGVGLSAVQAASLANASKIIAVGRNDRKLEMARSLGATDTFNLSKSSIVSMVRALTDDEGVDYAFEAIGERFSMEMAYKCARVNGGKVIFIGIPRYGQDISIDVMDLFRGKSVMGTSGGRINPDIDFPEYVNLYLNGRLKLEQMITHRFKLCEVNDALDLLRRGGSIGRAILELTNL